MDVLILESSEYLQKVFDKLLKVGGFRTRSISSFSDAHQCLIDLNDYCVMIMNLDLFDQVFSGFTLRDSRSVTLPPTFGVCHKGDRSRSVDALNNGLDDCISYPFHKDEFLARVRALSRRPNQLMPNDFRVGEFEIDRSATHLTYKKSTPNLSRKEFMILSLLLENPNRTVSKENIISKVWMRGKEPTPNAIDVHISNIRKKLNVKKNEVIQTVHGLGYKISDVYT